MNKANITFRLGRLYQQVDDLYRKGPMNEEPKDQIKRLEKGLCDIMRYLDGIACDVSNSLNDDIKK